MPMCTYLHSPPRVSDIENKDIREVLSEVNEKIRNEEGRFYVKEFIRISKFRKKRTYSYVVYADVGGGEYQVINFYSENPGSSINVGITADVVCAYFMGILTTCD